MDRMDKVATFWRGLTLKPQGFTIVVAAFLPIIAIVAMGPAVPTMIEHFASDPDARGKVPAMIGAPGLAMAILAPFAGMLVDRFGRRPILLVSTLFYAIFGAAPLMLDSLDQIYTSRLLLGVAEAGILTVVNTLLGDYWEDRARKNWLFLQGLLGPFIAAIFSLIVGYASKAQWNGVFYVYLVALPIFVAMLLFLFEPKCAEPSEADVAAPPATAFPWASALQVAAVMCGICAARYAANMKLSLAVGM
jgi:MFS family permease